MENQLGINEFCQCCRKKFKSERTHRFECRKCKKCYCSNNSCPKQFMKLERFAGYCSYHCCPKKYRSEYQKCNTCQKHYIESTMKQCEECQTWLCYHSDCFVYNMNYYYCQKTYW